MAMLTWLADVLRADGLTVVEQPGWKGRGHGPMADKLTGVLCHHTAGPAKGNYPSLGVVTNGRPGLDGPLAQLGLARDGSWIVIAAGVAWHAGTGNLPWVPANQGNQYLIGVEAESTGTGDWTPAQLVSYPRGVAAILRHLTLGAARAAGHKEYTTRKIDPFGWPGDMPGFRATVDGHLSGSQPPLAPIGAPNTHLEMMDMLVGQDSTTGRLYAWVGGGLLEFPQGGSDPNGRGHGNLYADVLLDLFDQAYPDGPKAQLVALPHDIVQRIPPLWAFIDGVAAPTIKTQAGEQVAGGA